MMATIRASSRVAQSWLWVLGLSVVVLCGQAMGEEPGGPAGVPEVMLYEGYLTDAEGLPVPDGAYDFTFSLYDVPVAGQPLWSEQHLGVLVESGVVRVRLGDGTEPQPLDVPFDRQYYLGVQFGLDPEMVPRLELASTAYSFRTRLADAVPDSSITTEKLAPLAVTDDKIASVSWAKITDLPEEPQGGGHGGGGPSVPASVWHTRGNRNTDSERDYVGTADLVDLILATDGEERLRIAGDGSELEVLVDTLKARYVTSRVSPDEGAFFLADPRHGLRRSGGHDVRLYTTGGNILLDGGNVGIGTPAPTAKLHVKSTVAGDDGDINSYPIRLDTGGQGIAINVVGDSDVDTGNNFVSFWDEGSMKGRIEGQDVLDILLSWKYWYFTRLDAAQLASSVILLAGAAGDARPCPPLCFCPPGPGPIIANTLNVAAQAQRLIVTQILLFTNLGVTYESSSGDYAEWLERLDPNETIGPGDVVGVFGGKISKSTDGAEQIMVVSSAPIVVGNMPPEGTEHLHDKVAFVGQVPVKVVGAVEEGDYIVPSGLGDGTGVAVAPSLMTAREYSRIVGRAWGSARGGSPAMVTVAVGMSQGDVAEVVWRQQTAVDVLRAEIAAKDADVAGVRAELDELRRHVGELSGLREELAILRASLAEVQELAPAGVARADDGSASGYGWQPQAD